MNTRTIYLPVTFEQGLVILKRQQCLHKALGVGIAPIVVSRSLAGAQARGVDAGLADSTGRVAVLAVKVSDELMHELMIGDLVNIPPTARYVGPDDLELEHYAQERLWQDGAFSLELAGSPD